jgi:hypothetical protein
MNDAASTTRGATRRVPSSDGMHQPVLREMIPTDGSIVRAGNHLSIYCAPCARWIDCHDGIPPNTALARHAALVH